MFCAGPTNLFDNWQIIIHWNDTKSIVEVAITYRSGFFVWSTTIQCVTCAGQQDRALRRFDELIRFLVSPYSILFSTIEIFITRNTKFSYDFKNVFRNIKFINCWILKVKQTIEPMIIFKFYVWIFTCIMNTRTKNFYKMILISGKK